MTEDEHASGVTEELFWCAARVNVWRGRSGRPATPEMRHAARQLTEALQAAGLTQSGEPSRDG